MRKLVGKIPRVGKRLQQLFWEYEERKRPPPFFPGSLTYWESRYATGGNSGTGSYGELAAFKAEIINGFVREHRIVTVVEFGCGDGHQLELSEYREYLGFDVSKTAVDLCRKRFGNDHSKTFKLMSDYDNEKGDLVLSLDVIYHLIEYDVFNMYMRRLFESSRKYVIIYSSNTSNNRGFENSHIRHRCFTDWINANASEWVLVMHTPNRYPYRGEKGGSFADFFVYSRRT